MLLRFNQSLSHWNTLAECNQLMEGRINGLMEGWKSKILIPACYPHIFSELHLKVLCCCKLLKRECIRDLAFLAGMKHTNRDNEHKNNPHLSVSHHIMVTNKLPGCCEKPGFQAFFVHLLAKWATAPGSRCQNGHKNSFFTAFWLFI